MAYKIVTDDQFEDDHSDPRPWVFGACDIRYSIYALPLNTQPETLDLIAEGLTFEKANEVCVAHNERRSS